MKSVTFQSILGFLIKTKRLILNLHFFCVHFCQLILHSSFTQISSLQFQIFHTSRRVSLISAQLIHRSVPLNLFLIDLRRCGKSWTAPLAAAARLNPLVSDVEALGPEEETQELMRGWVTILPAVTAPGEFLRRKLVSVMVLTEAFMWFWHRS